ncbi:hypothetical protein GPALN_012894 [Globodera pallida]|nr:hypothetical protein GPALN_012894 [Globodera pallida]
MPSLVFPTLCFFVSAVVLANSQMTFSDGWGKRSAVAPFALLADRHMTEPTKRQQKSKTNANFFVSPDEDTLTMSSEMEACHAGYAQRLIQLHEQMLSLFSTYQQCQTKAAIETKKAMRQS